LTIEELRPMAETHIFYEVERLALWSSMSLGPSAFAGPRPHAERIAIEVGKATLESALLHLRNVVEFLMSPRPTKELNWSTVVAGDYFDNGWTTAPSRLLGPTAEAHRETMKEIHRRLAHLSTQRLTSNDPKGRPIFVWSSVVKRVPAVLACFDRFTRELEAAHPERVPWFDNSIRIVRR
jgi:hypothetical protein